MTMRQRRRTCWRTRAVQEGTVAVGDAAARKVRRAFEDAGDGRGAERGGDENGGAREGELADLTQRCRKRQHVSRRAGGRVGGREPYEREQRPLAMTSLGECAVHLRTPAMAAAPREGATKMVVRERASWRI
jgi:hypothetical protein